MRKSLSDWRGLALFAIVTSLSAIPLAVSAPRVSAQSQGIHIEVDLVNILASITDRESRPIPSLPASAFEVYDDGVKQKIDIFEAETHLPLDLALMIDSSMSTKLDFPLQREAAARFIQKIVRPTDTLSVFSFDDKVKPLTDFSSNVPRLQEAVRKIKIGAGTAMYDAVYQGSSSLEKQKPDRRRVLVLVTDAGESTSRASYETARNEAIRSGAMLYTVCLRPMKTESGRNTAGEHALQTITEMTGGAMFFPDDSSQLDAIFSQIDRELRTQYRIGYYPERKPGGGAVRKIELKVAGDYRVRYRQAYISPEDTKH
jgi:Ca-activated chloride channel family protein|nr:VWA domain-containing protein [Candidatus Acidoferrales bacterium]